jgi:hypothetical protein
MSSHLGVCTAKDRRFGATAQGRSEATSVVSVIAIDPAHVLIQELDLAGVDGGADPEPRLGQPGDELDGAANRSRRGVEGREDAVVRALDQPPAEAVDHRVRDAIVAIEQLTPAAISQSAACRIDDVGEKTDARMRSALIAISSKSAR